MKHGIVFLLVALPLTVYGRQNIESTTTATCAIEGRISKAGSQTEALRHAPVIVTEITSATDRPPSFSTTTDEEGRFRFQALAAGRDYRIRVQRAGFGSAYFDGSRHLRPTARIECKSGERITGYNIQVAPLAIIGGEVRDDEGELVARAPVEFYVVTSSGFLRKITAGLSYPTGEFRGAFPPGKYVVRVRPPQLPGREGAENGMQEPRAQSELVPTYYPGTVDPGSATPIQLHAGGEIHVTVQLLRMPGAKVTGRIVGWKAEMAGSVELKELYGDLSLDTTPDKNGSFTFNGVSPGKYEVVASAFLADETSSSSLADAAFSGQTTIDIAGQDTTVPVKISPQPEGRDYRGVIKLDGKAPRPLSTLRVGFLDPVAARDLRQRSFMTRFPINSDGSFAARVDGGHRVLPGTEALDDAWRDWYVKSILLDGRDITDMGLEAATQGEMIQITISDAGGSVNGVVVGPDSNPVGDAYVMLFPATNFDRFDLWGSTQADANGRFALQGLRPLEYIAVAWEAEPKRDDLRDVNFVASVVKNGKKISVASRVAQSLRLVALPPDDE